MEKLTNNEEQVMLVIWKKGEGVIKEFLQEMEEPRPPYTTLASIVKNLEKKGYLEASLEGNTWRYSPKIRQEEYKQSFLKGFVGNYFANSFKEMVSFFAKNEELSTQDLKDIMDMIEKGKDKK